MHCKFLPPWTWPRGGFLKQNEGLPIQQVAAICTEDSQMDRQKCALPLRSYLDGERTKRQSAPVLVLTKFVAAANVETNGGLLRLFHLGNQLVQRSLDPRLVPPNLERAKSSVLHCFGQYSPRA